MAERRLDAAALRLWAHTAVGELIGHIDEINQLNVFPVADSDTGTNMLFTMRAALACADGVAAGSDDVAGIAAALAAGAHEGARGNSGVILSQILRGISEVCAAADGSNGLSVIDARLLGAALRHAVALVVASMGAAVPGTIVTVLQAAASAVESAADDGDDIARAAAAAADAAVIALDKTPEQLDVLAQAGVVDAGGRGLLVLLDAFTVVLTGHTPQRHRYEPAPPHTHQPSLGHPPPRFEVMYQLTGCDGAVVETLRAQLLALGDSVVIAGDSAQRHSVHVHADDAGGAIEAGLRFGAVSSIQITALTSAAASSAAGSWARDRAVLAVVDGDGAEALFAAEGAFVLRPDLGVSGPITSRQLVRAIVDTGAAQVLVLPNGYVAAEELVAGCTAANGWGIDVVPLPTGSMVAGLAALAVHDAGRPPVDDGYTMAQAAAGARYGSVRVATEDALTWAGPCHAGDGLGIAGDEVLIVGSDVTAAGAGLIDLLMVAGGELITVLIGAGVDAEVGTRLAEHTHHQHLGAELVTYATGHRGDALLIGVE